MKLLKEVDPNGVASRKGKRLKRRTYHCKVNACKKSDVWVVCYYRVQTSYGIWMEMTNCLLMDCAFMAVLTGDFLKH